MESKFRGGGNTGPKPQVQLQIKTFSVDEYFNAAQQ